jgi:hypothetical protein
MKKLTGIIITALLLVVSGCKTIPIPNYDNQSISSYDTNKNTMQSVEKSIIKAAVSLGWKIKKIDDSKIEAKLNIRKHKLTVLITHDTKTVSVKYVDSQNLKYNGTKIHRQYANWVTNLLRAIDANNLVAEI